MREWPIRDVARATGLTSRTLRHYEQIGLLRPARVAPNGYRFYGESELSRLYRILSLRALELPLSSIRITLDDETALADVVRSHLSLLEDKRARVERQITAVEQTLRAITEGENMTIRQMFAGFDQSEHETEVRQRWGDEAWDRSAKRRHRLNDQERRADDERSLEINEALRRAAEAGDDPAGEPFQALVAAHHRWVTDFWGGRVPDQAAYIGLSELYVADDRFAAVYGGRKNAEAIRTAMQTWIAQRPESAD